jgi:hypothetical protein
VQSSSPPTPLPAKDLPVKQVAKAPSVAATAETYDSPQAQTTSLPDQPNPADEDDESIEVIEWESVSKPKKVREAKETKSSKKKKEKEKISGGGWIVNGNQAESIATGSNGMSRPDEGSKGRTKVDDGEWHEAHNGRKVGKKYKGKGGITVTSVRKLNPRPCHTCVTSPFPPLALTCVCGLGLIKSGIISPRGDVKPAMDVTTRTNIVRRGVPLASAAGTRADCRTLRQPGRRAEPTGQGDHLSAREEQPVYVQSSRNPRLDVAEVCR